MRVMKLYTSKAIAAVLDMTDRNVRKLKANGVIREVQPGLYDLIPTVNAYINYLRGDNKDGDAYTKQRARLAAAKAEIAELETQLRKGELHETAEIEQAMSVLVTNLRTRILALPAKLAPMLASANGDETTIYDILRAELEETLNEMSHYDEALKLPEGEDNGDNTAHPGGTCNADRNAKPAQSRETALRQPRPAGKAAQV